MGDAIPEPEHVYGRLSERARLALLRNPQGFVPPEFIGQVISVCGDDSVCYVTSDDDVPHFAIFQGPLSDYLFVRRQCLDAWWDALEPGDVDRWRTETACSTLLWSTATTSHCG
ncbi:hypothetical protein MPC38_14225 [Prescottella equi]|uniref:hypothetical protein n=1 Tax=Rhodococcus hoagii TaxID=43767 RepID=UPI001F5BF3F1|nr:hypothetical protein [Prescottella equi]UNQ37917.1 hypothetical protein MPC38_14225 [Prescottella equi]